MKKAFYSLLSVLLLTGAYACSDDTIGGSISDTQMEVIADSSFTTQGVTIPNKKILTRTISQLLGVIKATNYGTLKSDFVCQFMPANEMDTTGVSESYLDSLKLMLRIPIGGYTGDSVAPMRVSVYRLNKQLPSPIYSDFDPSGYYSKDDLLGSYSYTATALGLKDSLVSALNTNGYRQIEIPIKRSLAIEMFRQYKSNPSTFASPANFAKYFPGVYVTTTYGSGRVLNIAKDALNLYYRQHYQLTDTTDTIYSKTASYAGASPEVITNNNINLATSSSIQTMVNAGDIIVQAPTGYEVTLNFPAQEIINKYRASSNSLSVINNVYFEIPAEALPNEYNIKPPKYLLLVKTSEKESFFSGNKVADNKTSFYATYSSAKKAYIFSEMRQYILDILNNESGVATADDMNMTLTPVDVTTETSSSYYSTSTTVTAIAPAVSTPSVAKLNLTKAKIKLVYSKQLIKN